MKKALASLCTACAALTLHADNLDLFIVAGQSNAQGWKGDAAHYPADPEKLDSSIKMCYTFPDKKVVHSSDDKWINLGPQKGRFKQGHFGPEISFARELKKNGYNPAIFKFTKGATSLAGRWKAPGQGGLTDQMTASFKKAMAELKSQGHTVTPRAFVWIQGESDAGSPKGATGYKANLETLINHVRNDLTNTPDLKIILGVDEQHKNIVKNPQVLETHKQFAKDDKNAIFTTMFGLEKADSTHLTPAALKEHGHRLYTAFTKL